MDTPSQLEETLKWGEPSYTCKMGSTIRIGWKASTPDQTYLFFHCTSKLGETYKALYGDLLEFEKNRAIVLRVDDKLPQEPLKHCIALALDYHRLKHLPMLGV